jgi:hypothetical protein
MTTKPVVGWLPQPLGADFGATDWNRYSLRGIYRRALRNRANPRSREYMERLLKERYPEARLSLTRPLDEGTEVVLLYPDANGLGHGAIDRGLPPGARVLTGRGREFVLDSTTVRSLRVRRALERTFAVELVALAAAAVATPILLAVDLARGRT